MTLSKFEYGRLAKFNLKGDVVGYLQCQGCIYFDQGAGLPCAANPTLEDGEECEERKTEAIQLGGELHSVGWGHKGRPHAPPDIPMRASSGARNGLSI